MNTTYAFCFSLRNFRELVITFVRQQDKETIPSSQGKLQEEGSIVSVSSLHFYALSTNSFYCTLACLNGVPRVPPNNFFSSFDEGCDEN